MARGKRGRFRKVARRKSATPRVITKTRWRTRTKSEKKRKRRGSKRKGSGGFRKVAATVATVGVGATMGAMLNEAGLLYAVPTQNRTGISLVGWGGIGITVLTVLFAKREAAKIIGYGLGGGLGTTEVVRQIDNRGRDFRVALGQLPAQTYDPTPIRQLTADEQANEDIIRNSLNIVT